MAKKDTIEIVKKPPSVARGFMPAELPEGDNNKYTSFALSIMRMPKIDIRNYEQVQERILDYFQLCADMDMKPGVAAMAQSLGIDRRRLWEIKTGQPHPANIPPEVTALVRAAYDSLEALWESYMSNGKINPVTGIFLAKNNFGYQDKQEYVLEPKTNTTADPKVIVAKYDELPE